ncbi:flagellar motor protein MotS [Lentibacillus sp. CBA3610]|uniref:flagellar motor protein MotS n=1 Tax=Lentibacillus sp. CBA3610 TaxID=2518176 RepID=UPI0015955876|nr:flagellar motor protein MotS [Lentibacillus sp. CBA3610]QKY69720.1 flagellar motor protein MotB [Lentibacillus sp. CBA3610]
MKRRRIRNNGQSGAPKWMVTYSDMVTLILVFFILLFSVSQIDMVKFDAISESFRNRMIFDFYPSPVPMDNPTEHTSAEESGKNSNEFENPTQLENINDRDDRTDEEEQDSLDELMEQVEEYLHNQNLNDVISASRTDRGVVLVLQESILFDTGEAEILDSGKPFLDKVGTLLMNLPNDVKVEGHTDDRPISSYKFPSNWELSGARASSVIRYLIDENDFDASRFSSAGYGDTRPVVPNDSEENWSQNRRVEMVILENDAENDDNDS